MIDTIPIVYSPGCYGTYLNWCLSTLLSDAPIQSPFTAVGNSHLFQGKQLTNIENWRQYKVHPTNDQFVRLHPKTRRDENISDNLLELLEDVENIIYIYPSATDELLVMSNWYNKIWHSWFEQLFTTDADPKLLYDNWPIKGLRFDEIPNWVKREFLSYYLPIAWRDQVQWFHPLNMPNDDRIKIMPEVPTHKDIAQLIANSDCGLYVSRAEG